jgi:hypothetical protein
MGLKEPLSGGRGRDDGVLEAESDDALSVKRASPAEWMRTTLSAPRLHGRSCPLRSRL